MNNNKKTSKIKAGIISIITATLIWAAITYINPPQLTTTISNLPVRFTGEEELRERGLTVVGRNGITGLSVEVEARRDTLLSLSGGIFVEVDVSSIKDEGEYELPGNVTLPSQALSIEAVKFDTVPVKVDKIGIKEIPIKAVQTGSVSGSLIKTVPEDKTVVLTGARSEIDAVSYGEAVVDISAITADTAIAADAASGNADMIIDAGYVLMDENGSPITSNETISATKTRINILCEVYDAVTLPVRAVLSEDLAKDYEIDIDSISITPSTVEVGLRDMDTTEVFARVTDAEHEERCELLETENMYIPENVKTVRVRADIARRMTKSVTLDVTATNLASGLSAQIDKVTVTASGVEKNLTAQNITASVDLSGLSAGVHSVPVTIESTDAEISGSYTVNVTIS